LHVHGGEQVHASVNIPLTCQRGGPGFSAGAAWASAVVAASRTGHKILTSSTP
jgi:hypothetical protein